MPCVLGAPEARGPYWLPLTGGEAFRSRDADTQVGLAHRHRPLGRPQCSYVAAVPAVSGSPSIFRIRQIPGDSCAVVRPALRHSLPIHIAVHRLCVRLITPPRPASRLPLPPGTDCHSDAASAATPLQHRTTGQQDRLRRNGHSPLFGHPHGNVPQIRSSCFSPPCSRRPATLRTTSARPGAIAQHYPSDRPRHTRILATRSDHRTDRDPGSLRTPDHMDLHRRLRASVLPHRSGIHPEIHHRAGALHPLHSGCLVDAPSLLLTESDI